MFNGHINASAATGTRNRVNDHAPYSGICSVCLDGCPGSCEVGKSSYRGREVLYPAPFGKVTAGATKGYPVDYSHPAQPYLLEEAGALLFPESFIKNKLLKQLPRT